MLHRVYFAPGMFGFGRLGSYDYFTHLEEALSAELEREGDEMRSYVVDVPPTASIRKRAARLANLVKETATDGSSLIHLVGHSTGGLDARLVASPTAHLPGTARREHDWLDRLVSVTTLNTPHYGTPLASFFTTVSGQRMLYALSALTYIGLSMGAPPLAAASGLVVAFGRVDHALGMELKVLDRATDSLLKVLEPARSSEVRGFLDAIKQDQGAMVQLMPEAMDLFQAGVEDRPGLRYQSVVSSAPPPSALGLARSVVRPWTGISRTVFTTLYGLTSRYDERYPCAAPDAGEDAERALVQAFGRSLGVRANDGVVPTRSQIWGDVVWAGHADHLDVLGHFLDDAPREKGAEAAHVDWLSSGAGFGRAQFGELTRAVAAGMLAASRART